MLNFDTLLHGRQRPVRQMTAQQPTHGATADRTQIVETTPREDTSATQWQPSAADFLIAAANMHAKVLAAMPEPVEVYSQETDAASSSQYSAAGNVMRLQLPSQGDIQGVFVENTSGVTVLVIQGSAGALTSAGAAAPGGRILTRVPTLVGKIINAPEGTKVITIVVPTGTGPVRAEVCNQPWNPNRWTITSAD